MTGYATRGGSIRCRFTLVEMLVVISVIGILASLLMPALGKALHTAKQMSCGNGMRQLGFAIMQYINDNAGNMPTYGGSNGTHYVLLNKYVNDRNDTLWDMSTTYMRNAPGGLFFCPTVTRASESPSWSGGSTEGTRYAPNYVPTGQNTMSNDGENGGCWTLAASAATGWQPKPERRYSTIKSGCVIMGEKTYYALSGSLNSVGWLFAGSTDYYPYPGLTATQNAYTVGWNLHDSAANFLFHDGHVKLIKFSPTGSFDKNFIPLR